jgi:hypothetical protein
MRPYLSPELYIGNVSDTERRKQVETTFKHLFSNRPRHILKDEIYHWEKIYKVILDEKLCFSHLNFFKFFKF